MQMIFNISQFDLFDTYLPQFKAGFANASQVGGSGCHPPSLPCLAPAAFCSACPCLPCLAPAAFCSACPSLERSRPPLRPLPSHAARAPPRVF